ncbi:O-acetyl-ADP-ribose deacetylase (regulator of RNase III) [Streptomyces sp. KhCrAH-43]|uniref:type II toxin-antitoxin system antitoxin DNA ADP-ribosyl glycohydrolase DarG n=1 Tax=unclassified Streptomyces TaxID=2593676 RepID=UPI0003A08277|nr:MULTISPECIES: macro domain-containing protein [unclassified Streptomyces]MYS33868.1 Appr-1-p processing protein [Streptomyces sp. SID4920]MYX70353.1 Appr-1-p processing protein [Streptomyces sp. SID8373]RAJ60838.1 O-acetyl-ADP-ribose deacetylase (regulator of RNase III) [Streptomyces sp. KhCrAH-43]
MIEETHGNLLDADVDALVNTVNTVGVMGKGVALQFKQAFPDNFKSYKAACDHKEFALGDVLVHDSYRLGVQRFIINFPTKGHWRSRSRLQDIETGLKSLVAAIDDYQITSIAIPALGCGNGGLNWEEVRSLIYESLGDLEGVRVLLYPPQGAPAPGAMRVRTKKPNMSHGRAALLGLVGRYIESRTFEDVDAPNGASLLEIQKLMYLLQESGESLRLAYAKGRYGPYAENLNHVLQAIEGHYLRGYGDRTASVLALDPLELTSGSRDEAERMLASSPETRKRCDFVIDVTEGFQSAYGLELLATVHWAARSEGLSASDDLKDVTKIVHEWSRRKKFLFTEKHIASAWSRLVESNLVDA